MRKGYKRMAALWLLIIVAVVLFYGLFPYLSGFLGALVLFAISYPVHDFLVARKIPSGFSAFITIMLAVIIIVLPFFFATSVIVKEANQMSINKTMVTQAINSLDNIIPGVSFVDEVTKRLPKLMDVAQNLVVNLFRGVVDAVLNIMIMFFVLYYLLINKKKLHEKAIDLIPFNQENSEQIMRKFKQVTDSTIVTSVLIALLQGGLMGVSFAVFGIKGAFFWGFVGFLLSFIPMVGIPFLWVPAALIFLAQRDYYVGVGILICGLIISNIDNVLRPFIQEKVGRIHPLIILIGILVGLPLFGFLGIIFGPLLVSYFLLIGDMFHKEYLKE